MSAAFYNKYKNLFFDENDSEPLSMNYFGVRPKNSVNLYPSQDIKHLAQHFNILPREDRKLEPLSYRPPIPEQKSKVLAIEYDSSSPRRASSIQRLPPLQQDFKNDHEKLKAKEGVSEIFKGQAEVFRNDSSLKKQDSFKYEARPQESFKYEPKPQDSFKYESKPQDSFKYESKPQDSFKYEPKPQESFKYESKPQENFKYEPKPQDSNYEKPSQIKQSLPEASIENSKQYTSIIEKQRYEETKNNIFHDKPEPPKPANPYQDAVKKRSEAKSKLSERRQKLRDLLISEKSI